MSRIFLGLQQFYCINNRERLEWTTCGDDWN